MAIAVSAFCCHGVAMSLIVFILILCFLGFVAYVVQSSAKMHPWFKWAILGILIIVAVLLILVQFGLWDAIKDVKVPRL